MMESARSSWNDHRLDDLSAQVAGVDRRLSGRIDRLEDRMDRRFEESTAWAAGQFGKVDARFDRLESRFDALQRTIYVGRVTTMASIAAAVVATVLSKHL